MNRTSFLLGALCAFAGCSAPHRAAAPVEADASPLRHLEVLAADSMQGRRTGTPGNARARAYLLAELRRIGVAPVGDRYEHPFTFAVPGDTLPRSGVNLLARVTGTRRADAYLVITAHYDHVGVGRPVDGDSIYNGADDNASGVAALLALAEHFQRERPETSMIFALLDAEEMGLRGARALVASPPVPLGAILLNVNLDMVGHSEPGELYAVGTAHTPALRPVLEPVAARAPVRLLFGHDRPEPRPTDDWTLQSDQGAFHQAGIPFVYFGVEDHPDYHQPSDELESITPTFFVNAVRTITDAVAALDRAAPALARPDGAAPAQK